MRLCTGLQIRVGRFDSGSSLQLNQQLSPDWGFFVRVLLGLVLRVEGQEKDRVIVPQRKS